jgi:putative ABC transport system substrate-binding protein
MRRRKLLLIGSAAAFAPAVGLAQQAGRNYRLGFVVQRSPTAYGAMFEELERLGFSETQNLAVDKRGFGLRLDQLEAAAAEVARAQPDAIFSGGDAAVRATGRTTTTIPVIAIADDFLRNELVSSLARPAGNITGVSILAGELNGKRLELLIEMLPEVRRVAALVDPKTSSSEHLDALTGSARSRGVELSLHHADERAQIVPAIDAARASGAQALNVLASAFLNANRALIIRHAAAIRLPAVYQFPEVCREGGLAGYGTPLSAVLAQAAGMIGKILKGAKPADLPVEQPTKFELAINLQSAKALGLTVPPSLLARADEIIE